MTAPIFLSSSYRYFERGAVVDVQTIMDDFADEVINHNTPAWTNPSGTIYKSPVDGDGRFFQVNLSRVDAQKLTMELTDQNAVSIMIRRIIIPSVYGSMVRIYTGQYHFCIDVECPGADPEYFWGGILDLSPEAQSTHIKYVWGWGSRNNTTEVYSDGYFENAYMLDNATAASVRRINQMAGQLTGRARPRLDLMGYMLFYPLMFYVQPVGGGDFKYAGRACQQVLVPDIYGQPGTTITIPVDVGVTGIFRVLGGIVDPEPSGGVDPVGAYRVAIRVA
jgi:hypothetical protein